MSYNPSLHTATNKPLGVGQACPTDARSFFYSAPAYRPYLNTQEVITYLDQPKYRTGNFSVFIQNGNLIEEWWFKDGTADTSLVQKLTDTRAGGDLTGDLPSPSVLWTHLQLSQMPPANYVDVNSKFLMTDLSAIAKSVTYSILKAAIAINADFHSCTPTTVPAGMTDGTIYFPSAPGTYTNFKDSGAVAIVVAGTEGLVYMMYNGTYWTKVVSAIDLSNYYSKAQSDARYVLGPPTIQTIFLTAQLFDKTAFINTGFVNASGGITPATPTNPPNTTDEWRYAVISLASLPGGTTQLAISNLINKSGKYWAFLNGSGAIIGNGAFQNPSEIETIPNGAVSFRFNFKRDTDAINAGDTVMVNFGGTYAPYAPFNAHTYITAIQGLPLAASYVEPGSMIGQEPIKTDVVSKTVQSRNLADRTKFTDGFYFHPTTGSAQASSLYGYTDLIPVTPGSIYTGYDGINGMRGVAQFDINQTFISTPNQPYLNITVGVTTHFIRANYYISGRAKFQFEAGNKATDWVPFDIHEELVSVDGALVPAASTGGGGSTGGTTSKKIGLKDIERVVFFGDSFTDGVHSLRGKAYIAVLSIFTDWNIENYSNSGDDYPRIHGRIVTDDNTLGPANMRSFNGGGYGVMISFTNDENKGGINAADGLAVYLQNLMQVADDIRSLGYKPVIASEHVRGSGTISALLQSALSNISRENGWDYIDVVGRSKAFKNADAVNFYPQYYYGSHPGVRTNLVLWWPILRYIQSLPRPRSGIKIWRKRTGFAAAAVTDLLYNTIYERNKRFKEIYVTQGSLPDSQQQYYDDLTTLNGIGISRLNVGEYLALLTNADVAFADYCLVECICNAEAANVKEFYLGIDTNDTTLPDVYVRNWQDDTWDQLTAVGKTYYIADLRTQAKYDKYTFLLFKSGGFTLKDIYYTFTGAEGKDTRGISVPLPVFTAELLPFPKVDAASIAGWTVTGTLTAPFVPPDSVGLPGGITQVFKITTATWLAQSISLAVPVDSENRRLQVKVIARTNPPIFNSSNAYPSGAAITSDTYDFATVAVELLSNGNNIIQFQAAIGLHWHDVVWEFIMPFDQGVTPSTLTLNIKTLDKDIELASASIKYV